MDGVKTESNLWNDAKPNPMLKLLMFPFFFTVLLHLAGAQQSKTVAINDTLEVEARLIYKADFNGSLQDWKVEQMPGGTVRQNNGKLEITDVTGCTVWLQKEFEGPLMITYNAFVIDEGGPQDRVSDLNCFWMAKDMEHPNDFFADSDKRGGKFSNYDGLRLYYMGVGGHDNSKTRFRRYDGDGNRPLLPGHDLSEKKYLIQPNKTTQIKIIAFNEIIQYYRDGERIIDFYDPHPYTSGYFGLRTVNNHMTVDNFKVYRLTIE